MYIVISSTKLSEFTDKCSDAMARGAKPIGGIATADKASRNMSSPTIHFYQAFDAPDDFKTDPTKD